MAPPVKKTLTCPVCGMETKGDEKECSRCGWEFVGMDKFECPVCGELIPISSRKCPHCNSDLSRLSKKARSQSVDKIREVLMTDLHEIESLEETWKAERKFRCPKCAALLDGTEAKCPGCGQVLIGESGLRCPNCRTSVGKKRKKCPKCGASLGDLSKEALRMIPYVPEPLVEPVVEQVAVPEIGPCPVCEAIIPKESRRCPRCDADLTVEKPRPKLAEAPELPEAPVEQAVVLPQPEITRAEEAPVPQAEIAPKPPKRRLKAEKVTTIDFGAKPSARGLSNGVGQINGRGKVNGAGAVNGRSFVNGTGISNGLGPRPRERAAERTTFLTRLQLLAVFVALLVIISAFVFLSFPSEKEQFSIDGDFAEWDSLMKYGSRIQSTAPSSNITEWTVATQASDLFLYLRTQERMMSTSLAESYYLFVDADGSYATGYIIGSIGADYMCQLTGWDNSVNSTSLSSYSSSSDQFDWNSWSSSGSLVYSTDGSRTEAKASMPVAIAGSARFMLMSKDSMERGSVSYVAPLEGAVLVVEQTPVDEVALNDLVPRAGSVAVLTVRFTSEGGGGHIDQFDPYVIGAPIVGQVSSFTLEKGESREITINLDTSAVQDGRFVCVEVLDESIVSSYACVELIGSGVNAHVGAPPSKIAIDGSFADWAGRLTVDQDSTPVTIPSADINEVGNVSDSVTSFFYVSVEGEMCSGTYVPAAVAKPVGGGGGGPVIPTRHSAEDILRIYVDYDISNSTGEWVTYDSKEIGADKLIEVKGLFGRITSMKEFDYSSPGKWKETTETVYAAKDTHRIEIGVTAASLGGSSDIDFIVETTSWKGKGDVAMFDPSSTKALTRSWVIDSLTTSRYATSMSYQRKLFYDGVNYWSFFFNGADTVCKYSDDEGKTWVYYGRVFTTPGVNETSIWYDSSTSMVYAVGDTSLPSVNVSIRMGIVDAAEHKILWADKDSNLTTSLFPIAGKNTYISKDSNGYLWVLSTNFTDDKHVWHDLSAFRSMVVNSTSAWANTGQILPYGNYEDNAKGSIVPAGSGSDMWAIYTYAGYVCAKKYQNGAWPADYDEVLILDWKPGTSTANTDTSPPSVVVDGKGVVHVVYGTGRQAKDKPWNSIPQIFYSHNNTDSVTFTAGVNLDPSNDTLGIANYFPTISLDSSTGNLFVFWIQSDTVLLPKTLIGRKCVSGTWSWIPMGPQTTFTKQFLTSIYSVSGEQKICWQWTQNTTVLDVEVIFDKIPEFGNLVLPVFGMIAVLAAYRQRSRRKDERTD